jgi:AraC family transcriptional regulator
LGLGGWKLGIDEHVNQIVFAGDLVKIGRWRLPAGHPNFQNSGPTRHYLFVFPRTSAWIRHAGGRAFVGDANVVTYYNVRQEYTRGVIAPAGDSCDYYAVDPMLLRQVVAAWDPRSADEPERVLQFDHGPSDARAYLAQRAVYSYVRTDPSPDPLYVEESVVNILTHVLGLAYDTRPSQGCRQADVVERAREVMARRFTTRLTLSVLSRETGSSLFHLCRLFRAGTGRTIHGYLNQLRLRASLAPVLDSTADLSQVALALGYSTHSHFTSAFRTEYGVTPSSLREASKFRRRPPSTSSPRRPTAPRVAAPFRPGHGTT